MNTKTGSIILHLTRPGWRWAGLACSANLGAALLEGSAIGLLALALRAMVELGEGKGFLFLALCAIAAQIGRSLLQLAGSWATAQLQARVWMEGYLHLFQRIMSLPYQRAATHRLGDLTHLLTETQHLQELLSQINLLVRSGLLAIAYAIILVSISWKLSLLAFLAYAGISRLLRSVITRIGQHATSLADAAQSLHQRSTEFVQGIRVVHTFGRQEEALRVVREISNRAQASSQNAAVWGSVLEPLVDSLMVLAAAFFLIIGYVWLSAQAKSTLPSLLVFLIALHRMSPRLGAIHNSLAAIAGARPHLERIADFLEREEPVARPPSGGRRFTGLRDRIELKEVTLRYRPDEPPAVRGLTCSIPRGSFTALVGPSGAGKSTVVDLLIRLHEPATGQILVDGVPLQQFSLSSWLERVGVVAQDPFLFHASIWENIQFGKPGATREEILEAARAAHVEEFIHRLARGYETVTGDRGGTLSGGQRQRIALARALVRQPEILILDEATNALDSESEREIHQALEEQRGQRTLIVVAHRLSTVLRADQILVLKDGKLTERGTHPELLEQQGGYAASWQLQG